MGGYIALEIMRRAPQRVLRLALLSTSARPDTAEQTQARLGLIDVAQRGGFNDVPDMLLPAAVHESRRDDDWLRRTVRLTAQETGPDVFVRQQQAIIARPDSRPSLRDIACPALILHGDSDALITPENGKELADAIPGARFVPIGNAGHLIPLERPGDVSTALLDLFDD